MKFARYKMPATIMGKFLAIIALAAPASLTPAAADLPKGLVLHLDFEEVREQEVPNLVEVIPAGTGKEARFIQVAGAGHALSIRQNKEPRHYVEVADHPELNRDAFTVAAWVCPRRIDIGGTIVCKHDWLDGGARGFVLRSAITNQINFTIGAGGWISTNTKTRLPPQQWAHVACVFDGKKLSIFYGGKLEASTEITKEYLPSSYPVRIGHGAFKLDRHRKFDGQIDDVMIWNRALSAHELASVFKATLAKRPSAPTAGEIAAQVKRLGMGKYRDRETAQQKLLDLGPMILPELKKHTGSEDPELRDRTLSLLKTLSSGEEQQ